MADGHAPPPPDLESLVKEQGVQVASLLQENERLAAFTSLQEDLLFSLSHDLKTPPVVIRGFAELLLRGRYGALAAEQEKPVATIHRNVLNLADMVDQLLDFSRLLREIRAKGQPIFLGVAWDDAMAGLGEPGKPPAGFAPCAVLEEGPVLADPAGLAFVLGNIARNALRIARTGAGITSRIERGSSAVSLAVVIPALAGDCPPPDRLLGTFFQASSEGQMAVGLGGPGLAAGRYLSVSMGGELSCEEIGADVVRLVLRLPAAD